MKNASHLMKALKLEAFLYIHRRRLVNGISGNLLNLLCDFLRNRKQGVLLNRQAADWSDGKAGVPPGLNIWYVIVLYIKNDYIINDLLEGLYSNAKIFADNTYLFSVIYDKNTSVLELNNNLENINR